MRMHVPLVCQNDCFRCKNDCVDMSVPRVRTTVWKCIFQMLCQNDCVDSFDPVSERLGVSVPRVRLTVWPCVFKMSERLFGRVSPTCQTDCVDVCIWDVRTTVWACVSDVRITMWTCACVVQVRERLCERGMPVAMWDNKYVEVYNYVCCGCGND